MNQYQLATDSDEFALSIVEINDHLKTSFASVAADPYLAMLVKAVETFGENFTKRTFTQKSYRLLLDSWQSVILLERAPLIRIQNIKYNDENDVEQTVTTTDYYNSFSSMYASSIFLSSFNYPSVSERVQSIKIRFLAGYGIDNEFIPKDLKAAMLNHLAELYSNRGDCGIIASADFMLKNLPDTSRLLYSGYIIREICL